MVIFLVVVFVVLRVGRMVVFLYGMCKNMRIFKQVQKSPSRFDELRIVNISCWGWELGGEYFSF